MDTHIDSTHRLHDRTTRVPDAYNIDVLPHLHPYPCVRVDDGPVAFVARDARAHDDDDDATRVRRRARSDSIDRIVGRRVSRSRISTRAAVVRRVARSVGRSVG